MEPERDKLSPTTLRIDAAAWVAPGVVVVGDVTIGARSSVWYGCVLRGDLEPIEIGSETNIQDLTMVHVDRDLPAVIGDRVTIGHRCVVHGCIVEDEALIGMGSVLLSGCRIGGGALVAAGAVVREGFEVPPGRLAAGVPARVLGGIDESMRKRILGGAATYVESARRYASGELGGGPHDGR